MPTYGGCTVERETGETRKVRGDPRGKARGKRPYLVHVGIAAGGRVTGIYLGRGVRARDSMQDRAGLSESRQYAYGSYVAYTKNTIPKSILLATPVPLQEQANTKRRDGDIRRNRNKRMESLLDKTTSFRSTNVYYWSII